MKKITLIITIFLSGTIHALAQASHCPCPTSISRAVNPGCSPSEAFYLYWNPDNYLDQPLLTSVDVNFGTNCTGAYNLSNICTYQQGTSSVYLTWGVIPCASAAPSGSLSFSNGLVCSYNNGILTEGTIANCINQLPCNEVLGECRDGLIKFAADYLGSTSGCKQWEGPCNTDMPIYRPGQVSIGTTNYSIGHALTVKSRIITEQFKVTSTGWGDYVFEDDYKLMPLVDVEKFIAKNRHLPGCTPGKIIEQSEGFDAALETKNQQVKIEEVFLYLINLQKQLDGLEKTINEGPQLKQAEN